MGFTCGIVGLPNVGKSTLFNALTAASAAVANYPFCTIEPNRGVIAVPDPRLDFIAARTNPARINPTHIEFLDIAGLVAGAHRGEGLGNQFLGHIRTVDAIAHIVRTFRDDNVTHVSGDVDPARDVAVVDTELLLADLEQVERKLDKCERLAKVGDRVAKTAMPALQTLREALGGGTPARKLPRDEVVAGVVRELSLLTAKPVIYVANVDEAGLHEEDEAMAALRRVADRDNAGLVKVCAQLESEIIDIPDPEERAMFCADLGLSELGLLQVARAGYALMDLITFYTTKGTELSAWTVPRGTLAPAAAGRIHTDFEKAFIRAEVIHWEDYARFGDEHRVREAGLLRIEGREYEVRDGDILRIRI